MKPGEIPAGGNGNAPPPSATKAEREAWFKANPGHASAYAAMRAKT